MARLRTRSLQCWLLPTALLAAAVALHPAPAGACSYALRSIEASYPAAGAVAVPINAVLFVYGHSLSAATVQLLDADGTEVPMEIQPVEPSGFDVRPLSPLEPERTYELRAPIDRGEAPPVRFTTGTGPAALPERLEPPQLDLTVLQHPLGPCGEQHTLCLDTAAPPGTSLEVRIGEEVLTAAAPDYPSTWFGAYGTHLPEGECLEVRARDVQGHRSAPRTVCGADVHRIEVPSDATVRYTCENYAELTRDRASNSFDDPGFAGPPDVGSTDAGPPDVGSTDAGTTAVTSVADGGRPEPQYVTLEPNDSEPAASSGCQLMASAARSNASMLSLGLLALLSMRRRRAPSHGPR
jgi:hypothetical protein